MWRNILQYALLGHQAAKLFGFDPDLGLVVGVLVGIARS